ncbi:PREDICTED: uncharacterized protein LOC105361457 [Ceratosolen solmsi marchali]|uniref:Uncharacterized protein LOC105361457 n=1 Tax=Ceratosolen solmsi marchali TaxID=326594 RepID=A0AAJ6YF54_9HYME|nr:PREDICTED: uncharacterized protein LOC105361457 [Ceratosolen solmsi marchali]
MPKYMELSPTSAPGQGEEDCLYPISPQMLPSGRPYVQPHPLTQTQLYTITKPPSLCSYPLPIFHEFLKQLDHNPATIPIFQNYYYNTLPFARDSSPQIYQSSRNMSTEQRL